jgi:deazaflavin-dependent oxidoreductase (nitroreductase family)
MAGGTDRYLEPNAFDRGFQRVAEWLTARGISLAGSRVLAVRGRTSGEWRTVPVNLLEVDGERYLVAPRGVTQWVRNLRVAGTGELRLGKKVEEFAADEVADTDKGPIIRTYLDKWGWEVGRFFDGLDKNSDDAAIAEVAPGFPVFRLAKRT